MVALSTLRNFPHGSDPMRFLFFRASRKVEVLIFLSRFFRRLYFQLSTFNCRTLAALHFSTNFHNSFESHASRKPFLSASLNPTVSTLSHPFESLTSYP